MAIEQSLMMLLKLTVDHSQFVQPLIAAWHWGRGHSEVLAELLIEPAQTLLTGTLRGAL